MKQYILQTLLALAGGIIGGWLVYNFAPLSVFEFFDKSSFGSTSITTILGSDTLSASRTTLNNNFASLLYNKAEISDVAGTTTLPYLATVGTIISGIWHGTAVTAPYGGTGSTTLSQYQVLLGNGTGNVATPAGWGSSGQSLVSNGQGVLPSWQSVGVNQTLDYTWTGLHIFNMASSSAFSILQKLFIGTTATSTIQGTATGTSTLQGFLNVSGTNSTSTFSGGLNVGGQTYLAATTTLNGCVNCLSSYEVVTGTTALSGGSPSTFSGSVSCTTGKKVIGGGIDASTAAGCTSNTTYIAKSAPNSTTGWQVSGNCQNSGTGNVTIYAICVYP